MLMWSRDVRYIDIPIISVPMQLKVKNLVDLKSPEETKLTQQEISRDS